MFGARGISTVDITVYGPRGELHSGHYGNWAPNPAMMLVQLLASMKDAHGRVLVDGFYNGIEPLSQIEKEAIAEAPDVDSELMREFWLGSTENAPGKLAGLIMLPSLNIRGLASSRIGSQASNVIPATASATIDMRIVKVVAICLGTIIALVLLVIFIRNTAITIIDHYNQQQTAKVDGAALQRLRQQQSRNSRVQEWQGRETNKQVPH